MLIARVDGEATATICHPSLRGRRLALCQPVDPAGVDDGPVVLAVDTYNAARGQRVLLTTDGKSIRDRVDDPRSPIRYFVLGIVDGAEVGA